MSKVKILDTLQIDQKLSRLAYEVYENNFAEKELLIVGIDGNGYKVANHLCEKLKKISPLKITLGKIKLNKDKPWEGEPLTDFEDKAFVNKTIILVDDVLPIIRQQPNQKTLGINFKLRIFNTIDSARVATKKEKKINHFYLVDVLR
jgi:pyrimidine operon attenuation protein/uracil phosphoribosyltransferase